MIFLWAALSFFCMLRTAVLLDRGSAFQATAWMIMAGAFISLTLVSA